jgi:sulfur carrier protein
MEIKVNGITEPLETEMNLLDFVSSKGLEPTGVVLLLNDEIVKREYWTDKIVKENDSLEVLRFVSGG